MATTKTADDGTAVKAPTQLKVHHLRPAPGSHKPKTRVGRGEGSKGKTAGRGTKGTKARYQVPIGFEGGQMPLHMRLPKLKGFTNPFRTEYQVVNLDKLASLYPSGGTVSVDELVEKGAVRSGELVKVLGTGEITVAVNVTAHRFSASAKEKIEAAGGTATLL
jgi:large subunit ribosomal protein L15